MSALTQANGVFSNCGPGIDNVELSYDCRGPSCSSITGFKDITCNENDGGGPGVDYSIKCSNNFRCPPGVSTYRSNFTFSQNAPDSVHPAPARVDNLIHQQQDILIPDCAQFSCKSDGTKEGTSVTEIKTERDCGVHPPSSPSSLSGPKTATSTGINFKSSSTASPQQFISGSLQRRPSNSILFVAFLLGMLILLPGAQAYIPNIRGQSNIELRARAKIQVRGVSDKVRNFALQFDETLVEKANAQSENGDTFAHNLVADVTTSVCGAFYRGETVESFTPHVVGDCIKTIYGGESLPEPGLQFLAVFGASLLCDYAISEAFPLAKEFSADGCKGLEDLAQRTGPIASPSNAPTPPPEASNSPPSNSLTPNPVNPPASTAAPFIPASNGPSSPLVVPMPPGSLPLPLSPLASNTPIPALSSNVPASVTVEGLPISNPPAPVSSNGPITIIIEDLPTSIPPVSVESLPTSNVPASILTIERIPTSNSSASVLTVQGLPIPSGPAATASNRPASLAMESVPASNPPVSVAGNSPASKTIESLPTSNLPTSNPSAALSPSNTPVPNPPSTLSDNTSPSSPPEQNPSISSAATSITSLPIVSPAVPSSIPLDRLPLSPASTTLPESLIPTATIIPIESSPNSIVTDLSSAPPSTPPSDISSPIITTLPPPSTTPTLSTISSFIFSNSSTLPLTPPVNVSPSTTSTIPPSSTPLGTSTASSIPFSNSSTPTPPISTPVSLSSIFTSFNTTISTTSQPSSTPSPSCADDLEAPDFCPGFGCTSLSYSKLNCGTCNTTCEYSCSEGFCQCPDGQELDLDNNHCVNITTTTPPPEIPTPCVSGFSMDASASTCHPIPTSSCTTVGLNFCPGVGCTNLTADYFNCGACGHACSYACSEGTCVCPPLQAPDENGNCTQVGSEPTPSIPICPSGSCGPLSTPPITPATPTPVTPPTPSASLCASPTPDLCLGACYDFSSDNHNCGGCAIACSNGTACVDYTCTVPVGTIVLKALSGAWKRELVGAE